LKKDKNIQFKLNRSYVKMPHISYNSAINHSVLFFSMTIPMHHHH
jgi:hypothetical protein